VITAGPPRPTPRVTARARPARRRARSRARASSPTLFGDSGVCDYTKPDLGRPEDL